MKKETKKTETRITKEWNRGFEAGKAMAGRIILNALEESPADRIRRVCKNELGVENDNDIPF